jgi:hypothetical protein
MRERYKYVFDYGVFQILTRVAFAFQLLLE